MAESKNYIPWQNAGGPNECSHGYAAGIPCPDCDRATGARKFRERYAYTRPHDGPARNISQFTIHTEECDWLMEAYASSQLKKLDGVAQEAAEKIAARLVSVTGLECAERSANEIAAIIDRLIAEKLK